MAATADSSDGNSAKLQMMVILHIWCYDNCYKVMAPFFWHNHLRNTAGSGAGTRKNIGSKT